MDGIRLEIDRHYSEQSPDARFADFINLLEGESAEKDPVLASVLKDTAFIKKKKVITEILEEKELNWYHLRGLRDKLAASEAFYRLVSHWDTPENGKPKSDEQHRAEAAAFVKALEQE